MMKSLFNVTEKAIEVYCEKCREFTDVVVNSDGNKQGYDYGFIYCSKCGIEITTIRRSIGDKVEVVA